MATRLKVIFVLQDQISRLSEENGRLKRNLQTENAALSASKSMPKVAINDLKQMRCLFYLNKCFSCKPLEIFTEVVPLLKSYTEINKCFNLMKYNIKNDKATFHGFVSSNWQMYQYYDSRNPNILGIKN